MPTLYDLSQDLLALEALLTETGGEITDDETHGATLGERGNHLRIR